TSGASAFLQQAAEFHQAWGLQPKRVDSLQAVVDDLANDTGALSRVRIVTHAVDRGILMPHDDHPHHGRPSAHAQSEEAGLGFESELDLGSTTLGEITTDVRTANAAALNAQPEGVSAVPNRRRL